MEEENAICYVGGYVIASLKKQEGNEELLVGLDTFIEKDTHEVAALPTSAVWVEEVNRGGLTRITEETHQFFVAMEGSVRSHLTLSKAHVMDNTTKSRVKQEVFADSNVQFGWCLTGIILKVGEDAAKELLEMGCIHSLDRTTGLEYWTELFSFLLIFRKEPTFLQSGYYG